MFPYIKIQQYGPIFLNPGIIKNKNEVVITSGKIGQCQVQVNI